MSSMHDHVVLEKSQGQFGDLSKLCELILL